MKYFALLLLLLNFKTTLLYANVDELFPYPSDKHKDPKRTHRYVRDCQPIKHGHLTYEQIKPKRLLDTFNTEYIKKTFSNSHQYGHRTVVRNPLKMLSVLEPLHSGSCASKTLSYVAESAKQQHCRVAVNAGFFNPEPKDENFGECYGNVISNGRFVQDSSGTQNANFGVRKDGTIVVGYLSQDDVKDEDNPFVQLISGVGWVLRNGENYLKESAQAECHETETTGSLENFFNVQSARTLIGHDKDGYVHIVQFDGKTWESGITLNQAADYLKSIDIINAINFDGGGSATYVRDAILINYPTNHCIDNSTGESVLCPKKVSTIICVHDSHSASSIISMTHCCNRNYILVITLTILIGICLLLIVYYVNLFLLYRARYKHVTSSKQKEEALRNLLEQNAYSSGLESEEDEL